MTKAFCPRCGAEFTRKTARNTHFADGLCKRLLPAPKAEGLQQTNAAKRKLEEEEQDYAKLDHKRRKGNPSQSGPHEFDEDDVLLKPQGREAPPSDGNLASIPEGFPRLDLVSPETLPQYPRTCEDRRYRVSPPRLAGGTGALVEAQGRRSLFSRNLPQIQKGLWEAGYGESAKGALHEIGRT